MFSKARATSPIVVARVKGEAIHARPPRILRDNGIFSEDRTQNREKEKRTDYPGTASSGEAATAFA